MDIHHLSYRATRSRSPDRTKDLRDAGKTSARLLLFLILLSAVNLVSQRKAFAVTTALDTYVNSIDPSYGYSLDSTVAGPGLTGHQINLTSQTWRSTSELIQAWKPANDPTQNQWEHKVTIAEPDNLAANPAKTTALLFVDGGNNPGSFDSLDASSLVTQAALLANSVIVNVPHIPNQRLLFDGETETRVEDQSISKTFRNFLDGGDSQWPMLLPMVKSVVAAMDATQDYMQNQQGVTIDDFIIIGGSKRGWTTWLTAAVDDRVKGVVPAVVDLMNMDESMRHHRNVYAAGPTPPTTCVAENVPGGCSLFGGYSTAVFDYVNAGVMQQIAPPNGVPVTPRVQELLDIVDPYEYRDRLDMPKYVLNATGDEFFAPDSSQFYFDDLVGEKYLRYVPNVGHSLDAESITGAFLFSTALAQGLPLPEFSWDISEDGTSITMNTEDTPAVVKMWQATNPNNRDFRFATFGANWMESTLSEQSPGEYMASVVAPASGATAFMIEMTYLVGGQPLVFTTEVSVVGVPEPSSCAIMLLAMTAILPSIHRKTRTTKR